MAALRAVDDEGKPAPRRRAARKPAAPRAKTLIATAARSGDRRRLLASLRDSIAKQLDEGVAPRDMASLSKRLVDIANEIAEIDAVVEGDDVSDAAATPDEVWDPAAS